MLVTFQLTMEVDEDFDMVKLQNDCAKMLNEMEDIIAKHNYYLDASDWETDD